MAKPVRIYISGSHSCGKTTLARWVSKSFGIPLVTEVARTVLAELEMHLDTLRQDIDRTRRFQLEVFKRQAVAEDAAGASFVSDRACDNLAYAASHTIALAAIASETQFKRYMDRLKAPRTVVFFIRPHRHLVCDDGVRERADWDEIMRIDGMVHFMLEQFDVDYVNVASPSMADRARTVRAVLRALDVLPTDQHA